MPTLSHMTQVRLSPHSCPSLPTRGQPWPLRTRGAMFPERPAGQGQGEDSGFSNKENVGGGLTQSPQKHGRESRE